MAYQVFIAFVLGGMAAGASSSFSTVRHAYSVFAIPALMPLTLHFLLLNDTFHYVMAEIAARLAAEADLRAHQGMLEKVVEERTADLRHANEQLKSEIEERKQYEKALLEIGERLAVAQKNAEAANASEPSGECREVHRAGRNRGVRAHV